MSPAAVKVLTETVHRLRQINADELAKPNCDQQACEADRNAIKTLSLLIIEDLFDKNAVAI